MSIKDTQKNLEKQYGSGTLVRMGDTPVADLDVIPTGNILLDMGLGVGGYPRGRIVEIYGPESCIDGETHLNYKVRRPDGTSANNKGGTVGQLWQRFHGEYSGSGSYPRVSTEDCWYSIMSTDEDGVLTHNQIMDVVKTGEQVCYTVTTATAKLTCTAEHRFWTAEGYVKLADLRAGDLVGVHDKTGRTISLEKIESIKEVGLKPTFDLCMADPRRNYVAGNFVTHNSGKTTLATHAVAEAQKLGLECVYIDAEHAVDPFYTRALGVNLDDLWLSQPDSGEIGLEVAIQAIDSGDVGLVVIDSVAALTPRAEIEGEMGDSHVGLQARMMGQALRKMAGRAKKNDTTIIFINQLREKIGVMFGSPETTPGGKALKFYASIRLDIRRIGAIKQGVEVVGNETRVKVVKNKVAPPFKQVEFDIMYGEGVSQEGSIIDLGVQQDLIVKGGAWYTFPDGEKANGREAAKAHLKGNPEFMAELYQQLAYEKDTDE